MIIVSGATGQLGRAIVKQLVGRVPADQVGISVRDPAKAADLDALGVRVRRGDFTDPDSLRHAFEGATQVLLVSSNARASGGDPLAQHRAAIEAARTVGAGRIVYTSQMAASASSKFPPALDHAATEAMLRDSGLEWTALRHGFYGASALMMMTEGIERGVVEAPADGKIAWTAHADLAEADAIILVNPGRFDGPTPPLTAAEALDFTELAALASALLGRSIVRKFVSDDDMRAKLATRGAPPHAAALVMGLYMASRAGEFVSVDPTLERVIGHRPIEMGALIEARFSQYRV